MISIVYTDGGRDNYFKGKAPVNDCVARALTLASDNPNYLHWYNTLADYQKSMGSAKSARNGVYTKSKQFKALMCEWGFTWTPTMAIGQGCRVHVREEELPPYGSHILVLSGHWAAWKEGILYDTHDCSREGTRCVYGIWTFNKEQH